MFGTKFWFLDLDFIITLLLFFCFFFHFFPTTHIHHTTFLFSFLFVSPPPTYSPPFLFTSPPPPHHVKLLEQSQLGQIPCGLPVGLGGHPEWPNWPHDRENDCAATYNVNQQEHLVPGHPILDKMARSRQLQQKPNWPGLEAGSQSSTPYSHSPAITASKTTTRYWSKRWPEDIEQHIPAMRSIGDLDVMLVAEFADPSNSVTSPDQVYYSLIT